MKITAKKAAPDVYAISFDDIEVAIEGNDLNPDFPDRSQFR